MSTDIPVAFEALTEHRSAKLVFPPHPAAGTPARTVSCTHRRGRPASAKDLTLLRRLLADCPAALREFELFYSRWNGLELCCLPDGDEKIAAISLLPIGEWESRTDEVTSGQLSFIIDGCEDQFPSGGFYVVGTVESEETLLLLSKRGTDEAGESTAGKILYASMDPVLGIGEAVASSLFDLLGNFARDPAAFLRRVGYCYFLKTSKGQWGDSPGRYLSK